MNDAKTIMRIHEGILALYAYSDAISDDLMSAKIPLQYMLESIIEDAEKLPEIAKILDKPKTNNRKNISLIHPQKPSDQ